MSNGRTLLRKNKLAINLRPQRLKVGSPRRRVVNVSHHLTTREGMPAYMHGRHSFTELGLEADYHATKGYRVRRAGPVS